MAEPVDLNSILNPTAGQPMSAAWGDHVRTWIEFLADQKSASVYSSAVQAVTTGTTGEALTANAENHDNDTMHTGSSARLTFNTAGRYLITTRVQYATGAGSRRLTQFKFNGATSVNADQCAPTGGGFSTIVSSSMLYVATAADYVEVWAIHDVGSDLDVTLLELACLRMTR